MNFVTGVGFAPQHTVPRPKLRGTALGVSARSYIPPRSGLRRGVYAIGLYAGGGSLPQTTLGTTPYKHFGPPRFPPPPLPTYGLNAYSHFDYPKDYKGSSLGYNMSEGASHQTDWVPVDSTLRSAITITPNVILEAIENQ